MVLESSGTRLCASRPRAVASAGRVVLWCVLTTSAFAQCALTAQPAPEEGVPVIYRGQEIVRIHRGVGGMDPVERARLVSERLNQLVRDPDFDPTRLAVSDRETYSELVHDDRVLGDRDGRGRPGHRPAARGVRPTGTGSPGTKSSPPRERSSASGRWPSALGRPHSAPGSWLVLLWLLARLGRRLHQRVEVAYQRLTADPRVGRAAEVRATRAQRRLHTAVAIANTALAVGVVAVWVQAMLQVLPWSRPYARLVYRYLSEPIRTFWLGLLGVMPNLFYLAVIALTTFLVLRLVRTVFKEIEVGNIRLASFPDDWAEPTYKLVRTLVLAVAFIGAFPYVPGSQSSAFQWISLFLGVLVSLASSSALSNIIAGTILTYTRAFRLGNIVRIGETVGEVTGKRLLATQVRTDKNVVVSIPNSLILATQVLNYTTLAAERGLIVHTTVTGGYDVPWRQMHELLIAAAQSTEGVREDPPPFVLQTALNDFAVAYEINAFVASPLSSPLSLPAIYSALHASIQETFKQGWHGPPVAHLRRASRRQSDDAPRRRTTPLDPGNITSELGHSCIDTDFRSARRNVMPSLFMRNRSVFGCMPSRSAALPMPLIRQLHCRSVFSMCMRWTASSVPASPGSLARQAIAERRIELQRVAGGSNQGALDGVFELTHVARPVVPSERTHHRVRHAGDVAPQFPLMIVDEEPHQRRNVLSTLAQGWHRDRKHVESIVEIGPELPARHGRLQIMMRRSDHANVGTPGP